jgi:hypothetical protein
MGGIEEICVTSGVPNFSKLNAGPAVAQTAQVVLNFSKLNLLSEGNSFENYWV